MGPRRDGRCSVATGRLLTTAVAALASALFFQTNAQAQEGSGAAGELEEARQLNIRAVELYGRGQYDAAEPLYVRALRIREKALGPDHPDVAASVYSLAGLNLRGHRRGRVCLTPTGGFVGTRVEAAAKTAKFPFCQATSFPWPFQLR